MAKSRQGESRPELEVLFVCDGFARDPNSAKITAYGIFDSLSPTSYPAHVAFFVYVKLRGGAGKHMLRIEIIDPAGGTSGGPEVSVDLQPNKKAVVGARFEAEIAKAGQYTVALFLDGNRFGAGYHILAKAAPPIPDKRRKKK